METLIPMTDFVLEQRMTKDQIDDASFLEIQNHINNYYSKVFNYANFLKKPLKLGYFVPCDYNDNPLEEPMLEHYKDCTEEQNAKDWLYNLEKYNEAKEKVLFEFQSDFKSWRIGDIEDSNIEELLTDDREYILTETAKREIGLI